MERTLGIGKNAAKEILYQLEKNVWGRNTLEGKIIGRGKYKELEKCYAGEDTIQGGILT